MQDAEFWAIYNAAHAEHDRRTEQKEIDIILKNIHKVKDKDLINECRRRGLWHMTDDIKHANDWR